MKSYTKVPSHLLLVRILAEQEFSHIDELVRQTNLSKSSIQKNIALLRKQYCVDIRFEHKVVEGKRTGYYVLDWGVFSKKNLMEKLIS